MSFISQTLRQSFRRQVTLSRNTTRTITIGSASSTASSIINSSRSQSQCRLYSSTPPQSSALKNLVNRYSISGQQHRIQLATHLFRAAQHQALSPEWTSKLNIPNNFRTTHAMLSMHIWFIHKRLLAYDTPEDKESGKHGYNLMVQEELFDCFWNDTKARIRSAGVNEMTVHKHLKDAQQATFLHCTQYDHAYSAEEFSGVGNAEKRFEVVCDAVWKHILGGEEDVDEGLIKMIGAYIDYQLENIVYKLPDDYFDEGRIAWGNIPVMNLNQGVSDSGVKGIDCSAHDANEETANALTGLTTLGNNWMEVLTDAGKPYYWNVETNRTSWQSPE